MLIAAAIYSALKDIVAIGAVIIRTGFGVEYTIIMIRNHPKNSIGNYLSPSIRKEGLGEAVA